ncbi:MAG TPA: hypothetical protein GXZ98_04145 [Firmicutes bacterium]|jgi:hypothetical protein|nr:hypothetical protein [Bacillota bacterium]
MGLTLIESRTAQDGTILCQVQDEEGQKYLFEPLNLTILPKDMMYVEILRELRQILRTPVEWPAGLKIFHYQRVEKCGPEWGLLFAYDQELWAHWLEKGSTLDPAGVVAAARTLLPLVPTALELDSAWTGFYPGDLAPLGTAGWGLLDPRVQQLLAPYREGGERRDLFSAPEVRAGSPRTEAAYLYTLGLCLYQLATGQFPFPLQNRRETITAMLREEPLDPRYLQPQVGAGLAQLILELLRRKAQLRPAAEACALALAQAEQDQTLVADPEEARRFQADTLAVQEKAARKRRWYWRWQRYKWGLAVVAALLVIIHATWGGYDEKITPESTPLEVVMVFYDGLARLDAVQLEEPLAKGAGKEFVNMVSVLHVTSKMREAYEGVRMSFLELDRLTVNEAPASTPEAPVFTAVYRLRMLMGGEHVEQDRSDRLVLAKQKKEWRITELSSEVLREEKTPLSPDDEYNSVLPSSALP